MEGFAGGYECPGANIAGEREYRFTPGPCVYVAPVGRAGGGFLQAYRLGWVGLSQSSQRGSDQPAPFGRLVRGKPADLGDVAATDADRHRHPR